MKKSVLIMFIFGVVAFIGLIALMNLGVTPDAADTNGSNEVVESVSDKGLINLYWVYRVLIALAAAAISISIPGMLEINYYQEKDSDGKVTLKRADKPITLAEKEPTITASGAIAVFVLVYMFNPIF